MEEFHDPLFKQTDRSKRSTVMLTVVLFVTNTAFGVDDDGFNSVFRHTTVRVHVEPNDDPVHGSTSVRVVRLGVWLRLESLALSDFSNDLVKELGW